MTAKEIMTKQAECIGPDTSIGDAARTMKDRDIGFLPVCENDRLAGAVTDRDIAVRGVAERRDADTPVREIMSRDIVYCFEDDNLKK